MREFFGTVVSVIIVVIGMYVIPIKDTANRQDTEIAAYVYAITNDFVDSVELNGYISQDMYNEFLSDLDTTGNGYTISMVHGHDVYMPKFNETGDVVTGTTTTASTTYEDAILEDLYDTDGVYYLEAGDHFSVTVKNKNRTLSQKINRILTGASVKYSIVATAGGTVRNENY